MDAILVYDNNKKLFGIVPHEKIVVNVDIADDLTNLSAVIEYTEHRWIQCRDAKFFKTSTLPLVLIPKDKMEIKNSMIWISGHITNDEALTLEVI